MLIATSHVAWYVGMTLGFLAVAVVVALVAVILTSAMRIAEQTRTATVALDAVAERTASLRGIPRINASAVAILEAARAARLALSSSAPSQPEDTARDVVPPSWPRDAQPAQASAAGLPVIRELRRPPAATPAAANGAAGAGRTEREGVLRELRRPASPPTAPAPEVPAIRALREPHASVDPAPARRNGHGPVDATTPIRPGE